MSKLPGKILRQAASQKGMSLVEILVSLAILGLIAVLFVSGAGVATKAVMVNQERVAAESLAKSAMEYIKADGYKTSHVYNNPAMAIPADLVSQGYTVQVSSSVIQTGLDKVTVTVIKNGNNLIVLEDYLAE